MKRGLLVLLVSGCAGPVPDSGFPDAAAHPWLDREPAALGATLKAVEDRWPFGEAYSTPATGDFYGHRIDELRVYVADRRVAAVRAEILGGASRAVVDRLEKDYPDGESFLPFMGMGSFDTIGYRVRSEQSVFEAIYIRDIETESTRVTLLWMTPSAHSRLRR